jgi:hypothetical protein
MTNSEIQPNLNGYIYNAAELLQSFEGEVVLSKLKKITAEFIADSRKLGATDVQIDLAMFRACNYFDITVA